MTTKSALSRSAGPWRRTRSLVAVALAGVLGCGAIWLTGWWRAATPPAGSAAGPDAWVVSTQPGTATPDLGTMLGSGGPAGLLAPGDRPLAGNPANLPAYPGATRGLALGRTLEGFADEMANWEAPGETRPDQVWAFYDRAATQAGFVALAPSTQSASEGAAAATTRIYRRELAAGRDGQQILVVRVAPEDENRLRILLWLRYPMGHAK